MVARAPLMTQGQPMPSRISVNEKKKEEKGRGNKGLRGLVCSPLSYSLEDGQQFRRQRAREKEKRKGRTGGRSDLCYIFLDSGKELRAKEESRRHDVARGGGATTKERKKKKDG